VYTSLRETQRKATERHLPYEITQYWLPSDTGKCARLSPSQTGWYSIYSGRMEG